MNCKTYLGAAALLLAAPLVLAQDEDTEEQAEAFEEIVILGHPLAAEGLATPTDILTGQELEQKLADSIGATVATEPGIHNASFGVAVGRPVIHGLGGARVRVMEDRIDAMDVSVTSGDHAVTVAPFVADRVEIFKGPSALLYGSGAVGGVVDTRTGRIPRAALDDLSGKLDLRWADNGNAGNGSFRLDGGAGNFAWHLDGFRRKADDYEIPGFAESARLRAMEEEEHEEHEDEMGHREEEEEHHEEEDEHHDEEEEDEHHDEEDEHHDEEDEHHDEDEHAEEEEEEVRGRLPGSYLDTKGGAVGFSWVGERGANFSGGQKQRIAIARALLMDPRVLIFDDSTSSVDAATEFEIQQAMAALMRGRTTFVIAHRLRSLREADQILVLDQGRIVQRGKHDDLLQQGGLYREIYDLELRDQESAKSVTELSLAGGSA